MKRVPSPQRTAVVKHELSIFGKKDFDINNYYNDNKTLSLELLTVSDGEDEGLVSIGTVGLSEAILRNEDGSEFITRVELCAGAPEDEMYWRNVIISTAFQIIRSGSSVRPGSIIDNIINEYVPETMLPHIYLTVPFLWRNSYFPELVFSEVSINWLQCIAIHESEKNYVFEYGSEAFEKLLSEQEINIFDCVRAPVHFK